MISAVRKYMQRTFVRNVFTVASGTAVSQMIAMAFAPVITRLYGPEAYGLQGIFLSVVGLAAAASALGYPSAIVLPRSDQAARQLVRLSLVIGVVTALVASVILVLWGQDVLGVLNAEKIGSATILIPIAILGGVIGRVMNQWLVRKHAFRIIATYAVVTASVLGTLKVAIGYLHPSGLVLIVVTTLGGILGSLLTFYGWRKHAKRKGCPDQDVKAQEVTLREIAKTYYDFPLLRTPQNFINGVSQQLPVLLLASFSGSSAAGQYSIAIAVLGMPATLIGGSVMSVFYPRVNAAIRDGEDARSLIIRATVGMMAIGVVPFLVIIAFGSWLFTFVFGASWNDAGVYAQWLAPWLFLQFINKPAVSAMPALNLQGGLLLYEIVSTAAKISALMLGFVAFHVDVVAIALFSISGSIAYIFLILWVIHKSGAAKASASNRLMT